MLSGSHYIVLPLSFFLLLNGGWGVAGKFGQTVRGIIGYVKGVEGNGCWHGVRLFSHQCRKCKK